jgi:hypothetical protein
VIRPKLARSNCRYVGQIVVRSKRGKDRIQLEKDKVMTKRD